MKIEICEETKWAVLILTIAFSLCLTIGITLYFYTQRTTAAMVNGYSEVPDHSASTHWEKK